jgi:hypothetical protein
MKITKEGLGNMLSTKVASFLIRKIWKLLFHKGCWQIYTNNSTSDNLKYPSGV